MQKLAVIFAILLALGPASIPQDRGRNECIQRCLVDPPDPDISRQEILNLEREAAHAIQLSDGTFFRRVYSDDFSGTLSRGEAVTKTEFLNAVQSTAVKYDSFNASDIKIHVYRDTAVATCLWSSRAVIHGQSVSSQMRVIHIYVNGGSGWKVVAGQASALPPYTQSSL
jgi:ketosteroid isomerase-like protein